VGRIPVSVQTSDPFLREGIAQFLGTRPELELLAENQVGNSRVLVIAEESICADVLARLRHTAGDSALGVVLVTSRMREVDLLAAVECGVNAVLPIADSTSERLVRVVLSVSAGRAELPGDLLGALLNQVNRLQREVLRPHGLTPSGLSVREIDVLRLLADGLSTGEIAEKLAYSERAVKHVMHTLMARNKLRNRSHAVAYGLRSGVI